MVTTGSVGPFSSRWVKAVPVAIFLAGMALTTLFWSNTRQSAIVREEQAFEHLFDRLLASLQERAKANEQILRSVVGLFDSSRNVQRHEFQAFISALRLEDRYPGIQGVGFSTIVPADKLVDHVKSIRTEGFPHYNIRPPGPRNLYTSIIYLEPFNWRNQRAFGYDMYSEPVRHKAMERARQTGKAALSGKVTLVQETETNVQSGFLLYVPIFRHDAPITGGQPQLLGWAYSPIRMNDMVSSMFMHELADLPKLMHIIIHDGESTSDEALLYRSAPEHAGEKKQINISRHIPLAGHGWTISAHSLRAFHAEYSTGREDLILFGGSIITLLLVLLAHLMARGHLKTARQVEELRTANEALDASTHELQKHRDHLEEMVAEQTEVLIQSNTELSRAKDAAEAANHAKDAFLANMSHELRTPLNAISGMTYLIKRDVADPKQTSRLGKIDVAVQHLLSIISDVLEISKIEAGKFSVISEPVNLEKVVNEVVGMIGSDVAKKRLQLQSRLDPLPEALLGDGKRLRQALLNYCNNAIKFTEFGSIELRVSVAKQTVDDLLLKFEVADTGTGIEAEVLPHLFQPFEQGDNSMTRKYGGTGLGLAITQRLARLMGGEAGVSSTPGLGSTFWFTAKLLKSAAPLPVSQEVDRLHAQEILMRDHAGSHILLVEDDAANREFMCELLAQVMLDVDTAEDGGAAVEMVGSNDYALILMDIQMPGMNGLEATRLIRLMPNGHDVPVIAITANAFDKDREACLDAGMNDFVAKPFDPPRLFAILLQWLSQGNQDKD